MVTKCYIIKDEEDHNKVVNYLLKTGILFAGNVPVRSIMSSFCTSRQVIYYGKYLTYSSISWYKTEEDCQKVDSIEKIFSNTKFKTQKQLAW